MILERRIVNGRVEMRTPDGGIRLITHEVDEDCLVNGCCIHRPTEHVMNDWPYNWRADRGIMERICEHGIGHDDPDDVAYRIRMGERGAGVHGCDGCCSHS